MSVQRGKIVVMADRREVVFRKFEMLPLDKKVASATP
jgi:hypothetical protein